jgi:putative ABC transport system ATP-binding protein
VSGSLNLDMKELQEESARGVKLKNGDILINANGLSRHFRAGGEVVAALDRVDFTVGRGEFIALVGPSGSGKSTLLNLVGALDRPTAGEISVDGLSLSQAPEPQRVRHRRENVGFIFQSFNLLPTLSAVENVEAPMMLAEVGKQDRRTRALRLLESVNLAQRASHKPNQLSGGEKQRVAIARALANKPSLLLADEPTGNLDSKTGSAILDMLCSLLRREQLTMVLVTHDPQVAARADRIIHLQDGRVERIETRVQPRDDSTGRETP